MLMATTNQLCLDVAVIPLLWLLPMGLYLLSFILCFHSERWYSRHGFGIALVVALGQTCWILSRGNLHRAADSDRSPMPSRFLSAAWSATENWCA